MKHEISYAAYDVPYHERQCFLVQMYLYINVLCVNIREFPNVMSHVTDHNLSVIAMIFTSYIIASGCTTTQRQL